MKRIVNNFLEDKDPEASISVGADIKKINCCFKIIKDYYVEIKNTKPAPQTSPPNTNNSANSTVTIVDASRYDNKETKELKETLKQRDNEISNF